MCNGQTVPPFPLSVQPPLCSAHARVPAAAMQFINFNNDNRATEFEEGVARLLTALGGDYSRGDWRRGGGVAASSRQV